MVQRSGGFGCGQRKGKNGGGRKTGAEPANPWSGLEALERRLLLSATLDPTFGGDGIATLDLPQSMRDTAYEVIIQDDGRTVLAGTSRNPQGRDVLTLARYHGDGTLDTTFGDGGIVVTDFGGTYWRIESAVLDAAGGIIGIGTASPGGPSDLLMVRWHGNGELDTGFGVNGEARFDFGQYSVDGSEIELDSSGNLLVAGTLQSANTSMINAFVARFTSNGDIDTQFGGGDGLLVLDPATSGYAHALTIDAAGNILVAGATRGFYISSTLWRVTPQGELDTTFADAGRISTLTTANEGGFNDVEIDAQGRIVLATALSGSVADQTLVTRYNPQGVLDTSFGGGDGVVQYIGGMASDLEIDAAGRIAVSVRTSRATVIRFTDSGELDVSFGGGDGVANDLTTTATSLEIAADGKLVMGGATGFGGDYLLARYTDAGVLDATFDGDGWVTTNLHGSSDEVGVHTVVLPDGKVLVAGTIEPGFRQQMAVARYLPDGSLDLSFGGGDGLYAFSHNYDITADGLAADSQGRIILAGTAGDMIVGESIHIVRLTADGGLDATFANGGHAAVKLSKARVDVVAVDSQDRVVFGARTTGFILGRLTTSGVFDTTFSGDGLHGFPGSIAGPAPITDIEILADDGILAVGYDRASLGAGANFYLNAFTSTGAFYPTFGEVYLSLNITDFAGGDDAVFAVTRDRSGRILLAGYATAADGTRQIGVARYSPEGKLDTGFGVDGRVMVPFGAAAQARDIIAMPGGSILIVGETTSATGETDSLTVRLLADGQLDTSFDGDGVLLMDLGGADGIAAAVLDSQQRLQVTGRLSTFQTRSDIMLARFNVTDPNVNDTPLITPQRFTAIEETTLHATVTAVDLDNDPLTYELVAPPSLGQIVFNADGSFSYTPVVDDTGPVAFTFRANDGQSNSNTGTATIDIQNVNDPPTANDDYFTVSKNMTFNANFPNVLSNDRDVDSSMTAVLVSTTSHGTLTMLSFGRFSYTPVSGYLGFDSFQYYATDGQYITQTVTVTLEVVNDAPVAKDATYLATEDFDIEPTLSASDYNNDPLIFSLGDAPQHGTVVFLSGPKFRYTPHDDYFGPDSFTYVVSDGMAESTGTVTIDVRGQNDLPVAVNDYYATLHETPLTVDAPGVLANDHELDGERLTAIRATVSFNGTAVLNADGSFTFTPAAGFTGTAWFGYELSDGVISTTRGRVYVEVTNEVPIADPAAFSTDEDASAAGQVTATDGDGDALTFSALTQPAHGMVAFNSDGTFVYTPEANFYGSDSFTFQAHDGYAYSPAATVSITVTPVNDAPIASDDALRLRQDAVLTISPALLGNDSDIDGDTLTVVVAAGPSHGTLSWSFGNLLYTPQVAYVGPDSFTYRASDGTATSNLATVTLDVVQFGAPSNLTASVSGTSITLNWIDNGGGFTDGFYIERASKPKGNRAPQFRRVATVLSPQTSWTNIGVSKGEWWYRIRAFDGSYVSPYSDIVTASVRGKLTVTKNNAFSTSSSTSLLDQQTRSTATTTTTFSKKFTSDNGSGSMVDLLALVKADVRLTTKR